MTDTASAAAAACEPGRKLRWALLCCGTRLAAWQAECVARLLACEEAEPVLLLVAAPSAGMEPRASGAILYRLFDRFWIRSRLAAIRPVEVDTQLRHVPSLRYSAQHRARAAAMMRERRVDFVLHLAPAPLERALADAARLGIWTYDPATIEVHGGTEAFWQRNSDAIYRRSLRQVTQHGTTILRRGSFGARGNAAASLDAMLLGSAEWGACACRQMAFAEFGEAEDGPVSPARPPSNREFLAIVARRAMRSAFDLYRRFFLLEYWNVGIIDAPVSRVVASGHPTDVHWLPRPPRHCFRADPFAAEDRSDVLMLEEYSYHLGRGWIAALPVHADHVVPRPIVAFAGNLHRSYPYVFAADGAIFCVPECAEDRSVALYRAVSFPDEWRRVGTLIEDFPALDSTIFAHDGRWWLFCTSAAAGCEHKLYAWYSESVTGPWRPHRLNPLKCDITSARPAGRPFLLNGTLCRPAQDCSAGYGSAITLNSVTALTPTCFEERIIGRIEPLPKSEFPDGIHTICAAGDKTIVDGKRLSFDARAAFFKLKGRRLARRIGGTARDAAAIGAEAFVRVSR